MSSAMSKRIRTLAVATVAVMLAGACTDSLLGPSTLQLARDISVDELDQVLTEPVRVQVALYAGERLAREVELSPEQTGREAEAIGSRITDLAVAEGVGTLTLSLGGLQVAFDRETWFRAGDAELGIEDFIAEVEADLAAGLTPWVLIKRAPRDVPQAPDDGTFWAARIALGGERDGEWLSLDVDGDNLRIVDTPPPDAVLMVLGIEIDLSVSDGRTVIEAPEEHGDREVEFEGMVREVGVREGIVVLSDNRRIQVVDATHLFVGDDAIESLEPVARALEAGLTVFAWGHGVIADGDGDRPIIVGRVVNFAFSDTPNDVVFEGQVREVGVGEGLVVLRDGQHVRVVDATRMAIGDQAIESLEPIAAALEQGATVFARGEGTVVTEGDRRVIVAQVIKFVIEEDPGDRVVDYEGAITEVDVEAGLLVIGDGVLIQLVEETVVEFTGDLTSLQDVADLVAQEIRVVVYGQAKVVSDADRTLFKALSATFVVTSG